MSAHSTQRAVRPGHCGQSQQWTNSCTKARPSNKTNSLPTVLSIRIPSPAAAPEADVFAWTKKPAREVDITQLDITINDCQFL